MSSEGWDILKQRKTYGEHVTITIDEGTVSVHVAHPNPLGLVLDGDANSSGTRLDIKPTREAADKVGFSISRLLEEVQNLKQHVNGTDLTWEKRSDDPSLLLDEINGRYDRPA